MRVRGAILVLTLAAVAAAPIGARQAPSRTPDIHYVPTPQEVVEGMLNAAKVTKNDVVYDLGSGDGRIPITAAQVFGARGVGIDIDPQRIAEATANAKKAGVTGRVTFRNEDLFTADISEATVVTLYLLGALNRKLLPKLNKELRPGTRVVSHAFDMGEGIAPQQTLTIAGRAVYLFVTPIR
jgi:cyclopropane fatty-acyl-phospholipid synthase-like methyltransferase